MTTENHPVNEAEIYHCGHCNKYTLHDITRNENGQMTSVRCVMCTIPK